MIDTLFGITYQYCVAAAGVRLHFQSLFCPFFFFNDTATTEIYTLSLHDALPISAYSSRDAVSKSLSRCARSAWPRSEEHTSDSSHVEISYAVFCLKKKKKNQ